MTQSTEVSEVHEWLQVKTKKYFLSAILFSVKAIWNFLKLDNGNYIQNIESTS